MCPCNICGAADHDAFQHEDEFRYLRTATNSPVLPVPHIPPGELIVVPRFFLNYLKNMLWSMGKLGEADELAVLLGEKKPTEYELEHLRAK